MTAKKKEEQKITLRLPDETYDALKKRGEYLGFNIQNLIMMIILKNIRDLGYISE